MNTRGTASDGWDGHPMEGPPAALVLVDAQGHIAGWGGRADSLLGYSAVEAVGRKVAELLSPDLLRPPGGQDWQGVLPIRRRDGRRVDFAASARAVHRGEGGYEWSLSAGKHLLLAPGFEDQVLADWVLNRSPVALTVYDHDLRCLRQNAAMRQLSGVADEDRIGRGLEAVLSGPDVVACEARMRRVLESGRPEIDFLIEGRTVADPDHDHVFSVSMSPIWRCDGQVLGVCTTVMDITEQHRSRERLALLNEASTYIGSTLDITRTAQELIELAVPRLADFATVDLLEGLLSGEEPAPGPVADSAVLRRVAHRSVLDGAPESVVRVGDVDVYPATSPPGRCLATGKSILNRRMDAVVSRWMAEDPVRAARTSTYGIRSWLQVPVIARGTTLGVALFGRWRSDEPFEEDDLTLAEELVARAAVCLDNARRFTRERTAALALQRSLLPQRLPDLSAVEAASRYFPAEPRLGVGGDWFDVIPLSGARVALVVGDVVGHGFQAAAAMGRLRTAVRTLADVDVAPDELLTQLDDLVIRLSDEPETQDDMGGTGVAGATCLYAVYDPVSGRCSIARAGHPAPLVVRPDGTSGFMDLPAGPLLGLGGMPFETVEVDLPEGGLIAFYTDGLIESRDRAIDAGMDMLSCALTAPADSLEDLCDRAVRALLPERPEDDAALLLVRPLRLDAAEVVSWDLPADPVVVARVRADAARQLESWGLTEASFVTELVVSELVTNAIRYGAEPIRLRLIRDRTLICEVSDGSSTAPHLRRARVFDEGGRGLLLVAQLTDRWGSRQHDRGKTIWCEQTLPGD
ncbi:SpoIIE family protein phosphatase [Streptomyces mirabilis]|uniref:SpoIIE family protein phosphatase n=1 Tax=Streptomyces mirabilis TaxID=68239 RepID=UPI00332F7A1D